MISGCGRRATARPPQVLRLPTAQSRCVGSALGTGSMDCRAKWRCRRWRRPLRRRRRRRRVERCDSEMSSGCFPRAGPLSSARPLAGPVAATRAAPRTRGPDISGASRNSSIIVASSLTTIINPLCNIHTKHTGNTRIVSFMKSYSTEATTPRMKSM